MNVFLSQGGSMFKVCHNLTTQKDEEPMQLYLAESGPLFRAVYKREKETAASGGERKSVFADANILQSFYYCDDFTEKVIIPQAKRFLLDSGAFTFFGQGKAVEWREYVKRYAEFIKRNDVKLYFELDIDPLIGYKNVLYYRAMLEDMTGKPSIPVWHKSRGIDEYYKMCESYDYVAIGGIVTKEITQKEYKFFPHLIQEAHKRGAKVHGLGFTNLQGLTKYKFDSVDSTTWVSGNRFGSIYVFNGKTMVKHDKQPGQRLASAKEVALHNFTEWVKFQKYAEVKL